MQFHLGSISCGTLRTKDLLEAFATELDYQVSHGRAADVAQADAWRTLADEARAAGFTEEGEDIKDLERADDLIIELQDALNECAPDYIYFGALEGDGTDYGFWVDLGALEEDVHFGEVLKLAAGDDIPTDYVGPVMFVTDHGNVSLGHFGGDGEFIEAWACV